MAGIVHNTRSLRLDKILSIHPELGPSVPDGGYGWMILIAISFFELIVPNLLLGIGVFILFSRLEHSVTDSSYLWDDPMISVPITLMGTWSIIEPCCRIVIKNSTWPRLVTISGTCLTSAGLFLLWLSRVEHVYSDIVFLSSGIITGTGVCLITCQCQIIINQYFKLKLGKVNTIRQLINDVGFIMTPILLGNAIVKGGLTHVMLWYPVIILQGLVACILIKKPNYLKDQPKVYNLVERGNDEDDEENVFDKKQAAQAAQERRASVENDLDTTTTDISYQILPQGTAAGSNDANVEIHNNATTVTTINSNQQQTRSGWETFEDDNDNSDLNRIENAPVPIFTPLETAHNNIYNFDDNHETTSHQPAINEINGGFLNAQSSPYGFVLYPTFYKSVLQIVTSRWSKFVFLALFPSYLYMRNKDLSVHACTYFVGCVGVSKILYTILNFWKSSVTVRTRALTLWLACWMGAGGYLLMIGFHNENIMFAGALLIVLSINALHYISEPLLLVNPRGETNKVHTALSIISGLSFAAFIFINITFTTCFMLMSFMQFATGCVWFGNYYYKKTVVLY